MCSGKGKERGSGGVGRRRRGGRGVWEWEGEGVGVSFFLFPFFPMMYPVHPLNSRFWLLHLHKVPPHEFILLLFLSLLLFPFLVVFLVSLFVLFIMERRKHTQGKIDQENILWSSVFIFGRPL